jgi:hypothetical protein
VQDQEKLNHPKPKLEAELWKALPEFEGTYPTLRYTKLKQRKSNRLAMMNN